MARLPRLYIKGVVYFITSRVEQHEQIYKDEKDYQMFLELLKKYQEQYGIKIFAYALMAEHFHLLVEIEKPAEENADTSKSPELSDFMRDLNNNYTKYFNSRFDRRGHLFRERFKSALVEKETNLLKMTAYIHLNPEKLGLVKDAREYAHSSYQLYLYNNLVQEKDLGCLKKAIEEALGLLENQNYSQYVQNLSEKEREEIHKKLQRGGILGSEEFVNRVKQEVEAYQASGEGQKLEIKDKKSYKLFFIYGTFVVVLIASLSGIYFLFVKRTLPKGSVEIKTTAAQNSMDTFTSSEWQVKMVPAAGGGEAADVISFVDGKFYSASLTSLGYPSSNYSLSVEDSGKIVWETMQTGPEGVASWRGEIEQGSMRGILSLRQIDKEPQDFSFISIGYRRKK